jgi:hypothetical protein
MMMKNPHEWEWDDGREGCGLLNDLVALLLEREGRK